MHLRDALDFTNVHALVNDYFFFILSSCLFLERALSTCADAADSTTNMVSMGLLVALLGTTAQMHGNKKHCTVDTIRFNARTLMLQCITGRQECDDKSFVSTVQSNDNTNSFFDLFGTIARALEDTKDLTIPASSENFTPCSMLPTNSADEPATLRIRFREGKTGVPCSNRHLMQFAQLFQSTKELIANDDYKDMNEVVESNRLSGLLKKLSKCNLFDLDDLKRFIQDECLFRDKIACDDNTGFRTSCNLFVDTLQELTSLRLDVDKGQHRLFVMHTSIRNGALRQFVCGNNDIDSTINITLPPGSPCYLNNVPLQMTTQVNDADAEQNCMQLFSMCFLSIRRAIGAIELKNQKKFKNDTSDSVVLKFLSQLAAGNNLDMLHDSGELLTVNWKSTDKKHTERMKTRDYSVMRNDDFELSMRENIVRQLLPERLKS